MSAAWASFKSFVSRFGMWIGFAAAAAAIIVSRVVAQRSYDEFVRDMSALADRHRAELAVAQAQVERERREKEAAERRYAETLDQIRAKYDAEIKALNARERARVDDIVRENAGDPEKVAKMLRDLYGIGS